MENQIPKDPLNPIDDMDVLDSLRNPKKYLPKKPKKVAKKARFSLKQKFFGMMILGTLAIELIMLGGIRLARGVNNFFEVHYLAFHKIVEVKTSWPVSVEKKEEIVVYVPVEGNIAASGTNLTQEQKEEIVANSDYPKVIAGIWMLETTQGRGGNDNDPTNHQSNCEKVGASNEFGYDPHGKTCFGSFQESVEYVNKWVDEHLGKLSLNQALCTYNTGRATDTCAYAQNYMALVKEGKLALK